MHKLNPALALLLLLALPSLSSTSLAEPILFHNFQHVDVVEQRIKADSWIIIDNGLIQATGQSELPDDFTGETRDMNGLYALPGLIDGHAHVTAGPHKVEIIDGRPTVTIESVDEITRFNALSALAHGVTTVRNPGGDTQANTRYDAMIKRGDWLGPTALHAGKVIQPSPFGGSAFAHPDSREAWFEEARRQAEAGMTYFKLYVSLSEDELKTGIEAAHAHGLQAIAHLDQVSWQTALELGVDGLEHALPTSAELLPEKHRDAFRAMIPRGAHQAAWFTMVDFDSPKMQELFATLHEKQTTLNLTLLVNEMIAYANNLDAVVTPRVAATMHPDSWAATRDFMATAAALWIEDDQATARQALAGVQEFTRRIVAADIPLLIGTDGNGAGPLMAIEMQLHADAGIPAWDVLALATYRSAKALELNTGRIAPSYEADLMFMAENPVQSFEALRRVDSVIVDGQLYTRGALLERANDLLDPPEPRL